MGLFAILREVAACGVMFAAGCSTLPVHDAIDAASAGQWAARQSVAEATARDLTAGTSGAAVKIRITHSARVGAFSWPDGTVELTRGLVDRLDREELAAAIAHELGHVLGAREPAARSALSGRSGMPDDAEARADRFATRLLARAGYAPEAMARTLTKVMHSPGMTPACRARLAKRIALLAAAP